jgi:radical SAM superfamily enzyme YgiQ (UPF0313 family)
MANIPLCERLIGTYGYSDRHMCPPPSESKSENIQLELTTGCSYGRCTFCDMYDQPNYGEKSIKDFSRHTDQVLDFIVYERQAKDAFMRPRIFIGAGNALSVDNEKFIEACQIVIQALHHRDFFTRPVRFSVYGRVKDVLGKGIEYMSKFKHLDTDYTGLLSTKVVYLGLESGSDKVLKTINKGHTQDEAVEAGDILYQTRVLNSTMIIPGLGGKAYFEEHVKETARVLNAIRPYWVTFMGLDVKRGTPYEVWMKKQEQQNKNRNLTPYEIVEQTAQIIARFNFPTKIGIYGDDIHEGLCHNPINLEPQRIKDSNDAFNLARRLNNENHLIAINEALNQPLTKPFNIDYHREKLIQEELRRLFPNYQPKQPNSQ